MSFDNKVYFNMGLKSGVFADSGQLFDESDIDVRARHEFADLDNDSDLGLIASYLATYSPSTWLNDGNGYFAWSGLALPFWGYHPALGDLNCDGIVDMVTTSGGTAHIYLGVGDGSFDGPVQTIPGGYSASHDVALADFNGDSLLDLVMTDVRRSGSTDTRGFPMVFLNKLTPPEVVTIDVKPGSNRNPINLNSKGVIPISIFTTDDFDASWVDISTVQFAGASPAHFAYEDLDGDGDLDLILHFKLQDTDLLGMYEDLLREDMEDGTLDDNHRIVDAVLTGKASEDGEEEFDFFGTDSVDLFLAGKKLKELLATF